MKYLDHWITFQSFVTFVIGIFIGIGIDRLITRRQDVTDPKNAPHKHNVKWRPLIAGLMVVLGGIIFFQSFSTQRASEESAKQQLAFAQEFRNCNLQFTEALSYRAKINADDTMLDQREIEARRMLDDAEGTLISTIFTNPAVLSGQVDDPSGLIEANQRYQEVRAKVGQERVEIDNLRQQNQNERDTYPYPEPTCGQTPEQTQPK